MQMINDAKKEREHQAVASLTIVSDAVGAELDI